MPRKSVSPTSDTCEQFLLLVSPGFLYIFLCLAVVHCRLVQVRNRQGHVQFVGVDSENPLVRDSVVVERIEDCFLVFDVPALARRVPYCAEAAVPDLVRL